MSSQRIGKYACLEIERKYLLGRLPADLDLQGPRWHITDHYLPGTRLRLRRMESATGQILYKFGQKYRSEAQSPLETTMTNLYLTEAEYERLAVLNASILSKTRYTYLHQDRRYGIDLFEGKLDGLILAEIECETIEAAQALPVPDFALRDVTDDPFFSGGSLVAIDGPAFRAGLVAQRK